MSTTDTSPAITAARTPRHVWAVGAVALLWNAIGAMDYVMTQTRNEGYMAQFTPEQLEYFYAFPSWVVASWALSVWGGVLGSILLLMRRRLAEPVFLVSLVMLVLTTIHNFVLSNGAEIFADTFSRVFMFVIFVGAVALYVYSRAMARRGVLR